MIIGISGYSQSGKDTLGGIIKDIDPSWRIKKFAGKLKQIASLLTGVEESMFEDQEFKMSAMPSAWQMDVFPPMTYRDFLQILGTESIRDKIHPDAWVNALMADYNCTWILGQAIFPKWIITDVRFPNEAKAIAESGGVMVRINRPSKKPVNAHPSETALDKWDFDFIVNNNKDIVDLIEPAKKILIGGLKNIV